MSSRNVFSASVCLPLILAIVPAGDARSAETVSTGTSILVRNCQDGGPGSLRDAVSRAASGDTIDLRSLGCSRILVTHGPVAMPQGDLTLLGRNRLVTLHGGDSTQVLRHTGSGTLKIQGLLIAHGFNEGAQALGGCVYSAGNLELRNSRVHHCVAAGVGLENLAAGGGAYALGNLLLSSSAVHDNVVRYVTSEPWWVEHGGGGGVFVGVRLTAIHSDILRNTSSGTAGGARVYAVTARYTNINDNRARTGGGIIGLSLLGNAPRGSTLANSTIARNFADQRLGAGSLDYGNLLVVNSTISSNSAENQSGLELNTEVPDGITVANSTFAFNHDRVESSACEGVIEWFNNLHLESTIVANNTCGSRPSDIEVDYHSSPVIVGSNNLIGASTVAVPPDTISANPRLGILTRNGGRTLTHALLSGSPAIDMGSNPGELHFDQRGPSFPRVKGASADIGAFER